MALKSFNELIKIDVRPQCDTRDAKDENGKTIKVPYLSWGKCVKLLHENGFPYRTPRTAFAKICSGYIGYSFSNSPSPAR